MKKIAVVSLVIGISLLLFYITELSLNGYINPLASFSLVRARDVAPFVGSFIAVFFSLAGTLLILENLRLQTAINERNQLLTQKNQFESIFFNLLSLHNKIINEIHTDVDTAYDKKTIKNLKGRQFFGKLLPSIAFEFTQSNNKSKSTLLKIYRKYYAIHASDLGHYFRNLYHVVNFVDTNSYFKVIQQDKNFLHQKDYMKILRAQLTNTEIACLALNGLSHKGEAFRPLIEKYELLRNLHFEFDLPVSDYWPDIPAPSILIEEYVHLKTEYEKQKMASGNSVELI